MRCLINSVKVYDDVSKQQMNRESDDDEYGDETTGWFGKPESQIENHGMCQHDINDTDENREYGWGEQSKTKKSVGDIADMIIDSCYDNDCPDELFDVGYYKSRRELKCRSCNKGDLSWRKISGNWVMIENTGGVHICEGYEPPIEVLKIIANEVTKETKKNILWNLKDKARERGGLNKLINILPDEQLIDLYLSFIRDDQLTIDNPDVGMSMPCYSREISFLRKEILRRMN